jgi:aryl-alcohol dehydrogenase-like predicted oxidoreductase
MGMSWAYGGADEADAIRVLHRALDLGINFWDTAEMYGPFANEELVGRAIRDRRRQDVIIATKFAMKFGPDRKPIGLDGSPAHVRWTVEGSLRRLGTDYIDLYYQHRLDPKTPIEETVGAMGDLVKAGKVRYIGLSEVGPGTIRRAHTTHPLSVVQSEYSLWTRGAEDKVLPTLRALGIGLVAYSPVGRGFLTGTITSVDQLPESDWRRTNPRFQPDNLEQNLRLVRAVEGIAARHGVTAAQLALAWVLRQGNDIVPIPGTRRVRYLEENAQAAGITLPGAAWSDVETVLASFDVAGARYTDAAMRLLDATE